MTSLPILFIMPLLGEANTRDRNQRKDTSIEMAGIDFRFTDEFISFVDKELSIPSDPMWKESRNNGE